MPGLRDRTVKKNKDSHGAFLTRRKEITKLVNKQTRSCLRMKSPTNKYFKSGDWVKSD